LPTYIFRKSIPETWFTIQAACFPRPQFSKFHPLISPNTCLSPASHFVQSNSFSQASISPHTQQSQKSHIKTMLLAGRTINARTIVAGLQSAVNQVQPCGVDVTLRRVFQWTADTPATIDFDNSRRRAAGKVEVPFDDTSLSLRLQPGAYLVEFNETISVPLDCMGQVFTRSTLWRAGTVLTAGVIDAGYQGAIGALLDVKSPAGVILYKNAKLGQITVQRMEEEVDGYQGIYQGAPSMAGRDGAAS
jgi:dUTP pyrophosphatase